MHLVDYIYVTYFHMHKCKISNRINFKRKLFELFLFPLNTSMTLILPTKHEIEMNTVLFFLFNDPHRERTQAHTFALTHRHKSTLGLHHFKDEIYQKPVSVFHSSHSLGDPGVAGKSPIHFINGYKLLQCKEV